MTPAERREAAELSREIARKHEEAQRQQARSDYEAIMKAKAQMQKAVQLPDGSWAEQAPPDCPQCSLAWPWDGTLDRVLVGWSPDGGRNYTCQGCGFTSTPDTYRIGMAPDGEAGR